MNVNFSENLVSGGFLGFSFNSAAIDWLHKNVLNFSATNLRPDRAAKFYFDNLPVDQYVQAASEILITGTDAAKYNIGEAIICETTNAYAVVVGSFSPNKLLINENFITLNVSQYGATALSSTTFAENDHIVQTKNNLFQGGRTNRDAPFLTFDRGSDFGLQYNPNFCVFAGTVQQWTVSTRSLVVSPIFGIANTTDTKVLWNTAGIVPKANLSSINVSNKFPAGATIKALKTPTKTSTVSSYTHLSGTITIPNASTSKINLNSTYTGTTFPVSIKITDGGGVGQSANITSVESGNTVAVLDAAITGQRSNSTYSIGSHIVDANSNIGGIFQLPESETARFRADGAKVFLITDASTYNGSDATMRATTLYLGGAISAGSRGLSGIGGGSGTSGTGTSAGTVGSGTTGGGATGQPGTGTADTTVDSETSENDTTNAGTGTGEPITVIDNRFTSPIPGFNYRFGTLGVVTGDPVAQTFTTPKGLNNGIFVSSIDLFFKTKPDSEDAQLPVTVKIVTTLNGYPTRNALAASTVQCFDVKTTDGVETFPRSSNTSTSTKFTFDDPVFLLPETEYAIVVTSESPSYDVWVAELGGEIVGDPDGRRVSEQPYVGSFFRSTNASTWTAYQNEDLMFKINRAVYDTSPITLTFGPLPQPISIPYDEIILNAKEREFPVANIDHKMKTTLLSTSGLEAAFTSIEPNRAFWFAEKPDSLVTSGRRRVIPAANTAGLQFEVSLDTNDDTVSPFFDSETYLAVVSENLINNGELYDGNISVTDSGQHSNASNVVVTISDSNIYAGEAGARATANVTLNASGSVSSVNIINAGKGYIESPTITITEPGNPTNATAVITSEDSKFGGNALARYITRKISLADGFDSGDLRVGLNAVRPQGTNIIVYYKVQSASDTRNFSDIKWRRMYLENSKAYSPDLNTPVEFRYNPSEDPRINKLSYTEDGVTYPVGGKFKYFAVKIVLLAECGCVAPAIKNFRAIALPEG
jgi:hypothetical protein